MPLKVAYDFDGAVALVTGGSRGIGRGIVEALAGAGARVHFTYRERKEEASVLEALPVRHGAVAHRLDVRDPSQVDGVVQRVAKEEKRLDLLVNNAGVTCDLLLGEMADSAFDDVIETNLMGPFYVIRAACRPMMRQRSGSIVNVSSVAGRRPERGQANYAASKGGLNVLTRTLSQELGPRGIRVNAVAPGLIPTTQQTSNKNARLLAGGISRQIPLRRFGELDEVAAAVLWLLSDAASYVSGAILDVAGGYRS